MAEERPIDRVPQTMMHETGRSPANEDTADAKTHLPTQVNDDPRLR